MSDKDNQPPEQPDAEELAKKLGEMFQKQFGSGGMPGFEAFMGTPPAEAPKPPEEEEVKEVVDLADFHYTPRDIKAHLDRFVIRQDEAKKVLSIAVCDHYNHARYFRQLKEDDANKAKALEHSKQNVIIVGPTGVGKTYLVKHIAEMIGVPFVKADATKFSETGYVGADVDDLVRELVDKADGDIELAEQGIIYIDEIDKLATSGEIGRDVSGRGVQTTLLKLMEETEVPLRNPNDMQGQMMAMMSGGGNAPKKDSISTRHILFIVSGAFSGLQKIVDRRLRQGAIGFAADAADLPMDGENFLDVRTQDFIDFGFEAEFIGRLPVRVVCEHLKPDDLFEIMMRSEGSVIRQYEREFEAYGIRAQFEEAALRLISERAAEEKTGARGLVTVCEEVLRDFKYYLPGSSVTDFEVTGKLVEDPEPELARYRELGKSVSDAQVEKAVSTYRAEFREENGITLEFDDAARGALRDLSAERGTSVLQLCKELFRDYQFGLKLIQKNTKRGSFELGKSAVEKPDKFLSDLVVRSYQDSAEGGEQ